MSNNINITVERINGLTMQIMPDGARRPIEDKTDWARLNAMTEAEIEAAAIADSDNPPLTETELKKLRRVPNPGNVRQQKDIT